MAGASYHRVEQIAGRAGPVLLGLVVVGLISAKLGRPEHLLPCRHDAGAAENRALVRAERP